MGEMIQFDEDFFQTGWFNHQLVNQYSILGGSSQLGLVSG